MRIMKRPSIALALVLLAPAAADAAVPKSPSVMKRFVGAYTERVHPYEVRGALALARSMSRSSRADEILLNQVKKLAPKLSIYSLTRMMIEMSTTGAQFTAASHYIDQHTEALTPQQVLEVAGGLRPQYPDTLPLYVKELDYGKGRSAFPGPSRRQLLASIRQASNAAESATARQHDELLRQYRSRRIPFGGLSAPELMALAKGAKLPATRDELQQAVVEATR